MPRNTVVRYKDSSGSVVFEVRNSSDSAPSTADGVNEGYTAGSAIVHNGTVYTCTDSTPGAAVWSASGNSSSSLSSLLPEPVDGFIYVRKAPDTLNGEQNTYLIAVPDGDGWYSMWGIGPYEMSIGSYCIGRIMHGRVGVSAHHSTLTKTGTWTTATQNFHYAGSSTWADELGESITGTVTGHTVGLRIATNTSGGYGAVQIDGGAVIPNRIPLWTTDDVTAGLITSGYVGWGRIDCYINTVVGDEVVPVADGLADGDHTITVHALGTKPAASSANRVYVSAIWGCSSSHAMGTGTAEVIPLVDVMNYRRQGASEIVFVPSNTSGTFYGGIHSTGGTNIQTAEAETAYLDSTAFTSLVEGTWTAGTRAIINRRLLIKDGSATDGTNDLYRHHCSYSFSAKQRHPFICRSEIEWLRSMNWQNVYVAMLLFGERQHPSGIANTEWDKWRIGDTQYTLSHILSTSTSQYDSVQEIAAAGYSSAWGIAAYMAMMDERDVAYWSEGGAAHLQTRFGRGDLAEKFYISLSRAPYLAQRDVGQRTVFTRGWGTTSRLAASVFS